MVVAVRGPSVYFMDPTIHCMCLKNIMTPVYIHTFYVKDLRIQTLYYYFRYLLYRSTYSLLYGTSPCTVKYLNNILNIFLNYDNNYTPTYLRTHTSNNSWHLVSWIIREDHNHSPTDDVVMHQLQLLQMYFLFSTTVEDRGHQSE